MSFKDCIGNNNSLTPKQKRELESEYDRLFTQYSNSMSSVDASASAARALVDREAASISQRKINKLKDITLWEETIRPYIEKNIEIVSKEKTESAKGGQWLHGNPARRVITSFLSDVNIRHTALNRESLLLIGEWVEKFRSKKGGFVTDTEGVKNSVRSMLGEKVTDSGGDVLGQSVRKVFDNLWERYRSAGGMGGIIENYFPTVHNAKKIKDMGFDKWKEAIIRNVDLNKMIDRETGLPMTQSKLEQILPTTYNNIISDGIEELAEALDKGKISAGKGRSFAEKRSMARVFHFKNADAFFEYNNLAGNGDDALFDMILSHVNNLSRDITLLEVMGPKPETTLNRLKAVAKINKVGPAGESLIDGMYNTLSGRGSYSGEVHWSYTALENWQHFLRATMLQGAPISALSDQHFVRTAAKLNGLDAMKTLGIYTNLLNPLDESDRKIAKQLAYVSSVASGGMIRTTENMDLLNSKGLGDFTSKVTNPAFLSGATHRFSGLAAMTDAVKQSVILSAQGTLANFKNVGTKFEELPPAMLEAFNRWDITKEDYANIMKSKPTAVENGAEFLSDLDLLEAGYKDTASKLSAWFTDMSMVASNEPGLLVRSISTGFGSKRGTWQRGLASSTMMFKSFAASVMINHTLPALRKAVNPNAKDRFSNIASLVIGTTVMGALSTQASNIVNGRSPEDMTNPRFALKAMMRGGGMGIFGDFMFADYSRYGNSFTTTLAGPVFSSASDMYRVFHGNMDKMLNEGEESKFASDLFQFTKKNTPFIRLWYIRPFMERLVLDNMERAIDPLFDLRMERLEERYKKQGSNFLFK